MIFFTFTKLPNTWRMFTVSVFQGHPVVGLFSSFDYIKYILWIWIDYFLITCAWEFRTKCNQLWQNMSDFPFNLDLRSKMLSWQGCFSKNLFPCCSDWYEPFVWDLQALSPTTKGLLHMCIKCLLNFSGSKVT